MEPGRRGTRIARSTLELSFVTRSPDGSNASSASHRSPHRRRLAEQQHFLRQNASQPFDGFSPVRIRDPGPDGPRSATMARARPLRAGPTFVESRRSTPFVTSRTADSRYWTWEITGTRRFTRTMVPRRRIRAHVEPRSGHRLLRPVGSQNSLPADAERLDQCRRGRPLRVHHVVGQDSRHL